MWCGDSGYTKLISIGRFEVRVNFVEDRAIVSVVSRSRSIRGIDHPILSLEVCMHWSTVTLLLVVLVVGISLQLFLLKPQRNNYRWKYLHHCNDMSSREELRLRGSWIYPKLYPTCLSWLTIKHCVPVKTGSVVVLRSTE